MTVTTAPRTADYRGDGGTVTFAVPFRFLAPAHLRVVLIDSQGVETAGAVASVAGVGAAAGGTVSLATAPATGVRVMVFGHTPLSQEVDFTPGGAMPGDVVERAFDKLAMGQQEQAEQLSRAVVIPRAAGVKDLAFPAPEANKGLKFDGAGKLVTTRGDFDQLVGRAESSATKASASATSAGASATQSAGSATQAGASAAAAGASATRSESAAAAAQGSATKAKASETKAKTSATTAGRSATAAGVSEATARSDAAGAARSATTAKASATKAKTSATKAGASATQAASSASNAAQSAQAAERSQNRAHNYAWLSEHKSIKAAKSETEAKTSATEASASATRAATSATQSAGSATSAAGSATTATNQAIQSAQSATAAQTSATRAGASETQAKASQTAAKTSETAAGASATSAAQSAAKAAHVAKGPTKTAVVHADHVAVGRVNDYRSGNSAVADILQLARSSDFDLTGIVGGTDGKELRVQCTGGGDVTLVHNSPHSAAGNRIWLSPSAYPAGEVKLQQGDTASLLYMRYNASVGAVWVLSAVTQAKVLAVPVGTILPFAGVTLPVGYLFCDGGLLSRTTYAGLFGVIGTTYGAGDGTTTFARPDLRAEFLRGLDRGLGVDKNRRLGSAQGDLFKSHRHSAHGGAGAVSGLTSNDAGLAGSAVYHRGYVDWSTYSGQPFIHNSGGIETRPRNVAVNFVIKY